MEIVQFRDEARRFLLDGVTVVLLLLRADVAVVGEGRVGVPPAGLGILPRRSFQIA